jgi:N-carbamoylputrescine amidase
MKVALGQLVSEPGGAAGNRERTLSLIEGLFADGVDLVILPELIISGYTNDRDALEGSAEPVRGPTLEAWGHLAKEVGGYVVGGFCERSEGRLFNSVVGVGPSGLILHYRKLHLFGSEKNIFQPGDLGLPVIDTPIGRIGACVCYDLRFVETIRILALRDAQVICVPTAWVQGFDSAMASASGMIKQAEGVALQANLNQVFIGAASQVGINETARFLGSSILADPYGDVVAGPASMEEESTPIADIDPSAANEARHRDPLISPRGDRRTDVYRLVVNGEEL